MVACAGVGTEFLLVNPSVNRERSPLPNPCELHRSAMSMIVKVSCKIFIVDC